MQNFQLALDALVKHPNTDEILKLVALWYNNFVPDVKIFKGVDAAQAKKRGRSE